MTVHNALPLLRRYPKVFRFYSALDPVADVRNLLESLTAVEYLEETLRNEHSILERELKERALAIRAHMRTALRYIDQANTSPPEVSFLPAYYAILNLVKTYIISGPHFSDLADQRQHGLTHRVQPTEPHTLLDDEISLRAKGALALAYATITGERWQERTLRLSDIYPYLHPIGAEYELLTGHSSSLAQISLSRELPHGQPDHATIAAVVYQWRKAPLDPKSIPALKGFQRDPNRDDVLVRSLPLAGTQVGDDDLVRRCLLYVGEGEGLTTVSTGDLLLPEEIPIALAFYHMSSVVRYNPEFFDRLRDSRLWPLVAALRHQGLYKAMVLAWSYLNNREMVASGVIK